MFYVDICNDHNLLSLFYFFFFNRQGFFVVVVGTCVKIAVTLRQIAIVFATESGNGLKVCLTRGSRLERTFID